jgi:hypothetical protein
VTGIDRQVADRLRELAALAGPAGGAATAERAVALARSRRRRIARWGAAVLVLCLTATVAGLTRPPAAEPSVQGRPTVAGLAAHSAPAVYRLPPRGSLVADEDLLAELADVAWSGMSGSNRTGPPVPEPETRRVVYATDLPTGQRWVVVIGRAGLTWEYAWLTGPTGADPDELELVASGDTTRGRVLALMDVTEATAPLVVLTVPGEEAEYSPSLDRTAGGELVRQFSPLPLVDGVPTATVTTPVTWDAGQVRLLRDGVRSDVDLMTTGQPDSAVVLGPNEPDPAVLTPCMAALGIDVQVDGQGGVTWSYDSSARLSSAEQAAQERAADRCWTVATGGA